MSTGYTKCPHDLLRNPNLTPVEKIVWLFIASHADDYTYTIYEACGELGISPNTWQKTIQNLAGKNMITATLQRSRNANFYNATLDSSEWDVRLQKEDVQFVKNCANNISKIDKINSQNLTKQFVKNCAIKEDQIKEQENNFINKIKSACACEEKHDNPKSETHPNGEKETKLGRAREALPIDALKTELLGSAIWIESIAKGFNLSQQEVQEYIAEFCEYLIQCGEECKPLQEAKKHFRNRLNILINGNNKQTKDAGDDRRLGVARLIARYTG